MFSLENQRLRGDMMARFKYLKSCHLEEGREKFQLAAEDRTHSNGFKLRVEQYRLDITKIFTD